MNDAMENGFLNGIAPAIIPMILVFGTAFMIKF